MNFILKQALIIIFILVSILASSQDFNGNYTSNFTSYHNNADSTLDYTERTMFNLFIADSVIIIQDVRIPDKLLAYFIPEKPVLFEGKSIYLNVINDHLNNGTTSTIIIYRKEDKINLLLDNKNESQMFFDLKVD